MNFTFHMIVCVSHTVTETKMTDVALLYHFSIAVARVARAVT